MVNKTPVFAGVFLCFGAGRCPVAPPRIPSDSIGGGVDKRGGQNYRINGAARFWPLSTVAIPFSDVCFRVRSCPSPSSPSFTARAAAPVTGQRLASARGLPLIPARPGRSPPLIECLNRESTSSQSAKYSGHYRDPGGTRFPTHFVVGTRSPRPSSRPLPVGTRPATRACVLRSRLAPRSGRPA